MKAAFTSLYDFNNPKYWSGTIHFMASGLAESGIELTQPKAVNNPLMNYYRAKSIINQKILKRLYFREREPQILKRYAKEFERLMSGQNYDLIFSPQTSELTYIESKKPMIFWVDATFAALEDELRSQYKLDNRNIKLGHYTDSVVIDKSKLAIYSSEWAAKSAIEYYKASPEKVKVVPFGANIKNELPYEVIKSNILSKQHDTCRLLFIGIDWERKGGDLLLKLMREFELLKFKAELHIVGCNPDLGNPIPKNIVVHSYIDKSSKSGLNLFNNLFLNSHFFIMLSHHEPYGLVYCEANSFGIPVIGANVGGVSTIIQDNVNGFIFNHPIDLNYLAVKVINTFNDINGYQSLSFNSYNEYITRLNWKVSCQKVKSLMQQLI